MMIFSTIIIYIDKKNQEMISLTIMNSIMYNQVYYDIYSGILSYTAIYIIKIQKN